jgi:hypothetical protein
MNDQAADLPRTARKEEAQEDLQEVRVGCESCGALLSVNFFYDLNRSLSAAASADRQMCAI